MQRDRAIKDLRQGLTPIDYTPIYGGPHPLGLQRILFVSGLGYPVTSSVLGKWNGRPLTLEAFLVEVDYPQWVEKDLTLAFAQQAPVEMRVRELYCSGDVLYARIIRGLDCYGLPWASVRGSSGLTSFPVSSVNSIELEGGESWRR